MKKFFLKVTDLFLRVIAEQKKLIPPFHGGQALGFYHVWTPGRCLWFQDDLSALLSPDLFRQFIGPDAVDLVKMPLGMDLPVGSLHGAGTVVLHDGLKMLEVPLWRSYLAGCILLGSQSGLIPSLSNGLYVGKTFRAGVNWGVRRISYSVNAFDIRRSLQTRKTPPPRTRNRPMKLLVYS